MKMHRLPATAVIALLSGCAASIPSGMPTAMIRATADVPTIFAPACTSDRSYVFNGLINHSYWSEVSPVKMYGTRSDKNNEVIERLIPAERNIAFILSGTVSTEKKDTFANCRITFGFKPKSKEQYATHLYFEENKCHVRLAKITTDSGVLKYEPIKPIYFNEQSDACK